jgi:hypothetical protein
MWWFIDEDGAFRIEHEKYFRDYAIQADLTSVTYAPDKPEVDQRVYSYEMDDVYNQLNYSESNQSNTEFIASPIVFNGTITASISKDIGIYNLTTDLDYVLTNPADATNSGLMLLRMVDMSGALIVSIDESVLTANTYLINGNLSWTYLFVNYWDYFAEAETGTVNGTAFTFTHVKEFLKQGNIKFRMTADLDWKKPFTVAEGTGWLEAVEYAPETGMYKIDIGFNPYDVVVYVVDSDDMSIHIVDDDGTTEIVL